MNFEHLIEDYEWRYSKGIVSDQELAELEQELSVTFPEWYKQIVKNFNGARPKPNTIFSIENRDVRVKSFLPIGEEHRDNLKAVHQRIKDKLPDQVIPIANDNVGNYICLDLRSPNQNKILFWEHEIM